MNQTISRRELIRRGSVLGSLLAVPTAVLGEGQAPGTPSVAAAASAGLKPGADVYTSIGVRPLINARGTFTIISGSTMLPEVRAAMDAAARKYVHLDELAEAVGARLAALTGAEWGLVTNGCSAGLTLASSACVAGGNPDLHVRLPDLSGFPKDEAIIPTHSRNVYDAAIRSVGLRVVEVSTVAELEAALGPRTALIYIMAGPRVDESPLSLQAMAPLAKAKGVPIVVDAAAEILTVPNVHLKNGATLVAYSGGKCLRGPQTGGLLLGRKDLVRAAWVHSAPHHGITRSLKVGKEDAIGMLMAVEMWVKRDHDAEWKRWSAWLDHIAQRLSSVAGVTTTVVQPNGLSNRTPSLRILWDRQKLGLTGDAVVRALLDGDPRIATAAAGGAPPLTGVSVTPYMMEPGDERIVADRLHALLSKPATQPIAAPPATPVSDLAGQWNVSIQFAAAKTTHTLLLTQRGNDLGGFHQGEFVTREISGTIDGDSVRIRSAYGEQHGDSVNLTFSGKVSGDQMTGTLDMGEDPRRDVDRRASRGPQGLMEGLMISRTVGFIALVTAGLSLGAGVAQQPASPAPPKFDLLLRGGHVIDARNSISAVRDVAIAGGKIAAVAESLNPGDALKTVDVTGLHVTPGLVDIHAHVYTGTGEPRSYAGDSSVYPDGFALRVGVTTVADAGGAGWRNFEDFKTRVIDRSKTRVLAFLNIVGNGMRGAKFEQNLADMEAQPTADMARRYPGLIVGIKTAHYTGPEWAPVERAVEAGTMANLPVMVDFGSSKPERPLSELVTKKLRPGDIYTHVYSGLRGEQDPSGHVNPALLEGRKRGVIFDVGHGGGSFLWRIAVPAIKEGFLPDSISTDLHIGSMNSGMKDMLNVMSKFLAMGLSLDAVIARSTWNPAREIKQEGLGHLTVGAVADVAVLRLERGRFGLVDMYGARMDATERLTCELTVRDGKVVYDLNGLSRPEWSSLPKDYRQTGDARWDGINPLPAPNPAPIRR